MREHGQIGIQHAFRNKLTCQVHAQRCHFAGAEMIVTTRPAQLVLRKPIGLQAEHGQSIKVRTLSEHFACLGPGAVEQDEQRALAGPSIDEVGLQRVHHPLWRCVLAREYDIRLPMRIAQQSQKCGIGLGARPSEREGIDHHIGDQPTGVARLEWLDVGHEQTHRRARNDRGTQCAHAMAENQTAAGATLALEATTGEKWFGAAGQSRSTQAGDGVGHAWILRRLWLAEARPVA